MKIVGRNESSCKTSKFGMIAERVNPNQHTLKAGVCVWWVQVSSYLKKKKKLRGANLQLNYKGSRINRKIITKPKGAVFFYFTTSFCKLWSAWLEKRKKSRIFQYQSQIKEKANKDE